MKSFRRDLARHLHLLLPLGILATALLAWTYEPGPLVHFRLNVFDEFLRLKPRQYEPTPVRIVDIDDDSLERFGQWPWPRTLLAKMLDRLNELGAAAVAFDFLFIEPDRTTPSRVIENLSEIDPGDPIIGQFKAMPDHDQLFAEAIKRGHVVLGFALRGKARARLPEAKAGFSMAGDDPQPWVPHALGAASNLRMLEMPAAGNALLDTLPERDGISRRVPLVTSVNGELYPALGMDALRVAQGARGYLIKSTGASGVTSFGEHVGVSAIKVGNLVVPTGADGAVWIHYTPHQPERFVSAQKILDGSVDAELIKDNIVIIGTTAEGLKDFRPTPLDPAAAGVEIHAQLIEQLLLGDAVERPDWAHGAEIIFMLEIGFAMMLLLPRVRARWTALLGAGVVAPALAGSWYAYSEYNWLIDPVSPSLVGLVIYLVSSSILFLRTEAQRRYVREAFSRYLAPAVVEHLAENPERLTLGGEMREITVMFSDIRSFTTIAEGLDPHELTGFLNRYLTPMTDVILSQHGTVDKYMADGIMAFWNAPIDDPEHADNACRAALAMRAELARLNDTWRQEAAAAGRPFREVRAGIGINTGECVVGNLGSDQRFDYSVIGDDANVGARLEGQTKVYGVDIIIGERTAVFVPRLALLEVDIIQVVGKVRPVRVYFILGDETVRTNAAFESLEDAHNAMLRAYRGCQWDEALVQIEICRAQSPEILQKLYQLYENRVAELRASPPPPDWDGVYAAATK